MTNYFHGSPYYIEKQIHPRPSKLLNGESVVFATDIFQIACLFGVDWTDKDIELGSVNGEWYMKELYKNSFKRFKKSCYVYEVDQTGFHGDDRLGMKHEFVNYNDVDIVSTIQVDNIWTMIKSFDIKLEYYEDKIFIL